MAGSKVDQAQAWILGGVIAMAVYGLGYLGTTLLSDHKKEEDQKWDTEAGDSDDEPTATEAADEPAGWGYHGSEGPDHWSQISKAYRICGAGKKQSPVDIEDAIISSKLLPIGFKYKAVDLQMINNGHTIKAEYPFGSYILLDGERFDLLQFHFHIPSEHKINGIPYDLEMHLVHKNSQDNLAVVAVLFESGEAHKALAQVWERLPSAKGLKSDAFPLDISDLLPKARSYYRYRGSLTTPPCSEGVRWFVMAKPLSMSKGQIEHFDHLFTLNARQVMPLNARKIYRSQR
jgi:carbonic anhydrase